MDPLFEVSLVLSSRDIRLSKFPSVDPETGLASITHFVIFPNTQQEKSTQKAHHHPCLKWRLLPLRLCPWENSNCNIRRSSPTVYCHGLNTRRALCWSPSGASWEYTRHCSSYFSATLLAGLDSKEWYLMSRSQPSYDCCRSARTYSLSCSSTCSAERTSHERPA